MSTLTWDQVLAEQHARARVLSPERLRAELQWQELTGRRNGLEALPQVWWTTRPPAPAPRAPRGRGQRRPKIVRPVTVETRRQKAIACPDGAIITTKRTTRHMIEVRT